MQQRKAHRVAQTPSITKPGALSLLSHILKGAVSDDMMLPAFFGIGLAIALYLGNFPYHEVISALLVTALLLIGLIRGIACWQRDLVEYRKELVLSRHRQIRSGNDYTIPGFIPFTRR